MKLNAKTAQLAFFALLEQNKLPKPTPEHKFLQDRKFMFDYAWDYPFKIALEVEGGIWGHRDKKTGNWVKQGAHNTGSAILRDIEKYNLAACNGWIVLRTTPDKLCAIETMVLVRTAFYARLDQVKAIRAAHAISENMKAFESFLKSAGK